MTKIRSLWQNVRGDSNFVQALILIALLGLAGMTAVNALSGAIGESATKKADAIKAI